MSVFISTYFSRYVPGGEASPGQFNFEASMGGGGGGDDESSGDGVFEADRLLFSTGADYPLDMSLVVVIRMKKVLIINNYPNSKLAGSGDTGSLLEIHFLEEDVSGICGAAVAGRERFFISSID